MNSHVVLEENKIWKFWHITLFPSGLGFDEKVKPYLIFENPLKGPMLLVGRCFFFFFFGKVFLDFILLFFLYEEKHFCNFWRIIMSKSILTKSVGLKETTFNWALKGVGNVTKDPNALSFLFFFFFFLNFFFVLLNFIYLLLLFFFYIKQSMNKKMHKTRMKLRHKKNGN